MKQNRVLHNRQSSNLQTVHMSEIGRSRLACPCRLANCSGSTFSLPFGSMSIRVSWFFSVHRLHVHAMSSVSDVS